MQSKEHWDHVYRAKSPSAVSWYRPHLDTSLRLIGEVAFNLDASIIDVGGGESTLVDDLLARGYRDLTVLDVSPVALEATRRRLGALGEYVTWVESDITLAHLPEARYDVWHDRAAFHFLTQASQRDAYVSLLTTSLKPGAYAVIATFGPEGPVRCSGLDVRRYDVASLSDEIGAGFELLSSTLEDHETPTHARQQFLYCCFRKR
ncbi:SAM-dependent methyltransferase [Paraburkholderia sp. WC7.3g]|uniref:Class I SAM-dependent methyltransferase n=1 Tax=Paraburkholderia podalyriae TaxID=1938811 RepID=A0ABR7PG63_9BURK|nr:class I SAM-dependent methyltransferase [Paraburkholderia podalyriae]MBC8745357.1 class I SAM-dependent methyltransferase [Paraburkholderia podalyriae]